MNTKLLAIDMDGTCLNSKSRITEETLVWLRRAREAGIEIVPTTGRTLSCIPHQLRDEPLYRYVITSNGAVVTDLKEQKTVFSALLPLGTALALMEDSAGPGLGMTAHIGNEYLVQGKKLAALGRLSYGQDAVSSKTVKDILSTAKEIGLDVEELQFFFFTKSARERTEQAIAKQQNLAVSYADHCVEIYSANATKGTALAAVASHLSVAKADVACIGDGENDIPMFRAAGLRFAMGNAVPQLKAEADRVVASNNENGVAEAIRCLLENS